MSQSENTSRLASAISISKYPRFLTDLYLRYVLQALWRRRGVKVGENVILQGKPILTMAPGSVIKIGDRCVICSRSEQTALGVNHPVILRTLRGGAELIIGSEVRMSGTSICAAERVTIGNRCVIGTNVTIVDNDFHAVDPVHRSSHDDSKYVLHKAVEIEEDVFIGEGSIILKGVRIGRGAIIGAGSVVRRNVPVLNIVAGNPAKPIWEIY
jgi:acetyltransferase-like isoleucine patch superfamily enzyme